MHRVVPTKSNLLAEAGWAWIHQDIRIIPLRPSSDTKLLAMHARVHVETLTEPSALDNMREVIVKLLPPDDLRATARRNERKEKFIELVQEYKPSMPLQRGDTEDKRPWPWIIPLSMAGLLILGFIIGFLVKYRSASSDQKHNDITMTDKLGTALVIPDLQIQLKMRDSSTHQMVTVAQDINAAQRYIQSISLLGDTILPRKNWSSPFSYRTPLRRAMTPFMSRLMSRL